MKRSAMPQRSRPMARTSLESGAPPLRAVAATRKPVRDTIPPKVRLLVAARDPWCVRSGSPSGLHIHHRRLKQAGGDPRSHTDCPCNLVRLTTEQHLWVHAHRAEAESEGLILPAETLFPGSVSVMVRSADGGASLWPSCGGAWLSEAPDGEHVHKCPPAGSGTMPCCGRTPFQVPRTDRMTLDPELVTCTSAEVTR